MHMPVFHLIQRYQKALVISLCAIASLPIVAMAGSYLLISPYGKYVLTNKDAQTIQGKQARVGLVMGSGVTANGKPYKELRARLDIAADALQKGYVEKLIVTGDNRFETYDEPTAMYRYLLEEKRIAADKLQPDFAGRDTYQSCERAKKIFGLEKTIIFSADSHLPRAIFLCRSFGIETYGIGSDVEANNSTRRELVARVKAVLNVYLWREQTILGDPIQV